MTIMEERIKRLEAVVEDLRIQVQRNHLILHGSPDLGETSGVLPRIMGLRRDYTELSANIHELTSAIEGLRRDRESERREQQIVRASNERWLKILGVLVAVGAVGGGAQAIQFIITLLQGLN